MKPLPFSTIRKYILIVSFLLLSGGIGYRLGARGVAIQQTSTRSIVINQTPPDDLSVDFSLFWDVWQRLYRFYIEPATIDAQAMVYGAIRGMVSSLDDPYTTFLTPKENKEFKQDIGGAFEGIGAQLGLKESRVIIQAPLSKSPAEKAGLRAGDWILKVDEADTTGWTLPQAVSKIRGPRGTTVTLSILHIDGQKPIDVTIVRDTITVPSVEWWVKRPGEITEISGLKETQSLRNVSEKIAYLKLSRFGDQTNSDWEKAIREIVNAQAANGTVRGLILDLRNNPGGYLDGSVFVTSEFIEKGIVVSQVNSDGTREDYQVNRKGKLLTIPLMVLVNKGSASASEIVAGSLKDHKRAILVGEVTFGKGSVQTPFELSQQAGLHVTTGKWLLPSGTSISKIGVTPDIEIMLDDNVEATTDAQLAKAIELLLK